MSANSDPTTCRGLRPRSRSHERKRSLRRRRSTHRLLRHSRNDGKQVRPWLAEPKMTAAPRVRESDWEPTSQSHQGQRHEAATKVRMYGCNLFLVPSRNERIANWGRPCTVIRPSTAVDQAQQQGKEDAHRGREYTAALALRPCTDRQCASRSWNVAQSIFTPSAATTGDHRATSAARARRKRSGLESTMGSMPASINICRHAGSATAVRVTCAIWSMI
jgi:hypothetical protein